MVDFQVKIIMNAQSLKIPTWDPVVIHYNRGEIAQSSGGQAW